MTTTERHDIVPASHEGRDSLLVEEHLLRALFDAMPQLGWTAQPDGFIDYYNRGWYEYTGASYADMRGWGWQSVHDPLELPRIVAAWSRCLATTEPFEQEFPLRRKDGEYRWFLTRVTPIFDGDGKLVRWVGINTDIDDQRRAQAALRQTQQELEARVRERTAALAESNTRLRAVTETAHDAIIIADQEGLIVGWNPSACVLFGSTEAEVLGQPIATFIQTKYHETPGPSAATDPFALSDKPLDLVALRRNGSEFPCELTVSSWTSGSDAFITVILRDTTDRKRAEEQARRLAAIIEGCDDAIYTIDLEGLVVSWNRGATRFYGYDAEDVVGRHFRVLVPEDKLVEAQATFSRALGGEPLMHHETVRRTKDGRTIDILWSASVFRDEGGNTKGIWVIVRDVTAQKSIERKLLLADRMASVGTLASGIVHQVNNPLSYVKANLDVLVEELREMGGDAPSAKLRELIATAEQAREGAERVRKIVRGLKTFSRSDAEHRAPVAVADVLDLAVNMAFTEVRHRARLVKNYAPVPLVEADESRLAQVFINLIVNAAQSITEGDVDGNEIRLSTLVGPTGRVVIEVADTGAGIPELLLKRVFDPFFTTKDVGLGTGLGLSICEGIVAALGGEMTAESQFGKGSTFRVSLPRFAATDGPAVAVALPSVHPSAG